MGPHVLYTVLGLLGAISYLLHSRENIIGIQNFVLNERRSFGSVCDMKNIMYFLKTVVLKQQFVMTCLLYIY